MVIRFYFASGSLGIIKFIKRRGAILSQGIKFFQNAFTPGCLLKKVKDLPPDRCQLHFFRKCNCKTCQ